MSLQNYSSGAVMYYNRVPFAGARFPGRRVAAGGDARDRHAPPLAAHQDQDAADADQVPLRLQPARSQPHLAGQWCVQEISAAAGSQWCRRSRPQLAGQWCRRSQP